VTPEPPRAPLVRRIGGDIGLDQLGEALIAEIGMQLFIVVAENLGEPGDIGVAIDAERWRRRRPGCRAERSPAAL
jgi:hypothetical protein